ncbi:MAG: C25 family cysteine peptidase [Candidatus Thermoplasmatota archaeon]|nr:C25 family cysteine peptidase [Candidatus Thermoplasmatota archaeon]
MHRPAPFLLSFLLTAALVLTMLAGISDQATGARGKGTVPDIEGSGVRYKLMTPEITLKEMALSDRLWTLPVMDGAIYPPTDGGPSVPVLVKRLEVKSDIRDIALVRTGPEKVLLDHPIPPSFEPAMIGNEDWDLGTDNMLSTDENAYTSNGPYPARSVTWTHLGYGWENGTRHSSYSVTYAPMDYDPSLNELTVYSKVEIMVDVGTAPANLLLQPTRVDPPTSYTPGTELLVIAHDPFMDDLNDYVEWKRETGKTLTVVGYSTVNSAYPALDGPASIWSYVRDSFFGDGQTLRWVLLAGEPRFVPSRMVYDLDPYYGEPQYLPADTYYSCLDGPYTNWDQDGDGRWGEIGDITDMEPEVYVSRISLDTEAEAQSWARKVVSYEKNPPAGPWSGTAAFFGSTTHVPDDGPTESEDLWDLYLDRVHGSVDRYYSQGPTQQTTGAKYLTYGNIQDGLTSGFSTVNYMGHGHYAVWSEGTQDQNTIIYTVNEASSLSNGARLPLIFAMSCETNWFDDASFDSISEEFTENPNGGAIAYLGAVRTTEGGIGFTPHQYTPGAPGIQEDVLRMIAGGKRSMAEIMLEAKEYYYTQWSAYFYSYEFAYNAWVEHSVLGPPDTELWTAEPKALNVVHSHENDRYTNFSVSVTDAQGNAVPDAVVCIRSASMDISSKAVTDQYGKAIVPFEITTTANGKLTVTKSGHRPFQAALVLTDNTQPKVTLVKQVQNPDGASGWYINDPQLSFLPSEPCDIRYRWNGGGEQKYTGSLQTLKGENTLEFWGKDSFGNIGEATSSVIRYDPDAPVVTLVIAPAAPDGKGGWYITTPVVEVSLLGTVGSEQRAEFWLDRSVKQTYSSPIPVPDGEHELHVLATDKAGNRADQMDVLFKVDTDRPMTTLSTGGVERNEQGFFVEQMSITLRTEDRSAKTYYRWDTDGTWSQYSSPFYPLTGSHVLHYLSEDSHGNREVERSEGIAYDITPPVLRYTISPQQPSGSNDWYIKAPTISLSGDDDNGNFTILYRLGGAGELSYERPILVPDGITTLKASIIDGAGNKGEGLELVFKVDSTADRTNHATDASPNQQGWYMDLPMITLRTDGKASIFYRFLGHGDFMRYSGALLPPGDEGSYQLEYYSVDEAGNRETTRMLYLSVDARAPEVVLEGPTAGKAQATVPKGNGGATPRSPIPTPREGPTRSSSRLRMP